MKKVSSLTQLLLQLSKASKVMPNKEALEQEIKKLQVQMLHIQQGIFGSEARVVIVFEGFDAAGKGGTIKTLTEGLDPRGFRVVPIAAPKAIEQKKHWLYRFWKQLPAPGEIVIFDRSWYGRVLVEKIEGLTPLPRVKDGYSEINQFEEMLIKDGIIVFKFFLGITKAEQLERLSDRLNDETKLWKFTMDDIKTRQKWPQYVRAVDEFLKHNDTKLSPWHLIAANSKKFARREVMKILTTELKEFHKIGKQQMSPAERKKFLKLLKKA